MCKLLGELLKDSLLFHSRFKRVQYAFLGSAFGSMGSPRPDFEAFFGGTL